MTDLKQESLPIPRESFDVIALQKAESHGITGIKEDNITEFAVEMFVWGVLNGAKLKEKNT